MRVSDRWVIAIAGVFLQVELGSVYAWRVFRVPLAKRSGLNHRCEFFEMLALELGK